VVVFSICLSLTLFSIFRILTVHEVHARLVHVHRTHYACMHDATALEWLSCVHDRVSRATGCSLQHSFLRRGYRGFYL
jgi:hypothetical protein